MITLKDGKIIDQWSTLIEQCQGHGYNELHPHPKCDWGSVGSPAD